MEITYRFDELKNNYNKESVCCYCFLVQNQHSGVRRNLYQQEKNGFSGRQSEIKLNNNH